MAENLETAEVRRRYISAMGSDLGPIYHELHDECVWLNTIWKQFVDLYGTNQRRLDVLNFSAWHFFVVVHEVLWQTTLLKLCRITDQCSTKKSKNLTVEWLPSLVDSKIKGTVSSLLCELQDAIVFARDWRNRHIAHADLALAMETGAEPLTPASRKMVTEAISKVGELLNVVERFYTAGEIAFDHLVARGQADDLVQLLNDAFVEDESSRERLRTHRLAEADLHKKWNEKI